jgi:hypothetical protein
MINRAGFKKYRQFHGKQPYAVTRRKVSGFNTLVRLASPELITYRSSKINGGGTGRPEYFKHKFSKSTQMYCTPDGKMLIIMGPNLRVNDRGIIG